ncbi:MAG: CDP-alcohol phosphatidyltransferase family protein, partial [Gammaproteobacteria bacterium]|nr:CDP-alcohol phosphatidyltransferase family protein [Gammaproteobacteria bacterium]
MDQETILTNGDTLTAPEQLFPLVRHLSYRLTPILLKTPATPNQITTISLLLGLACAACFTQGGWITGIVGGLLLVASYTFDNCDGEVARIKNMSSEFGAKLDDMSDWMVDVSFFVALGYGTAQINGQQFWLWLGLAAAAGAFIDYIVDLIYEAKKSKDPDAVS